MSDLNIGEFNSLFTTYKSRFIRFAFSYVGDYSVAEDIVMESFAAGWEKREGLDAESFPPYVLTAVKNRCLNRLRSQAVRDRAARQLHSLGQRALEVRISTLEATNPDELFSAETRALVERALSSLPARTREVFVRSRFRGESYRQIAAEMGTTVKSVEFEASKAMKIMRVALKDYLPILLFYFNL